MELETRLHRFWPHRWVQQILLACAIALTGGAGCGGDGSPPRDNEPDPIEVPIGLMVQCSQALDGGKIPLNTFADATVADDVCLIHRFDATQGAQYSVQVLIAAGGNVDVMVASNDDFTDLVTASNFFGDNPESATFTAEATRQYVIAYVGRAETSDISTRVVQNIPSPTGERDCVATVDGGQLSTDGTPLSDILFPRTCVLYTFEGSIDSIYELTATFTSDALPDALYIARDRDVTDVIDSRVFVEETATLYPVTDAEQTFYVIMVGEFSELATYELTLTEGNAPVGLFDRCHTAENKGAVSTDWTSIAATLAPRTCHIYSLSAVAELLYIIGLSAVGLGTPPELRIASDSDFRNLVTTATELVEGLSGEAFVAGSDQTFHVAILTSAFDATIDYSLRGLESAPAPQGLSFPCNRSRAEGSLVVDGPSRDGMVMAEECATFALDVQGGVSYTISALPSVGSAFLYAAEDPEHIQSLASSTNFSGPQGLTFTAPMTGTVHIAVAGRVDGTAFSLSAVTAAAPPAGVGAQCDYAVHSGTLTVGGGPAPGFAAADQCNLYTFSGTTGTSYTIRLTEVGNDNPDLTLATDSAFSAIIQEATTPGGDTIVFTASGDRTFHLAVHGFQSVEYTIEVMVSPAPPAGLAGQCSSVLDDGTLAVGAASVRQSAAPDQCVVYSFAATNGLSYTVTMFTSRGNPGIILADRSDFASLLTTETTAGGEIYTFTAAATQDFYLAVFPETTTTTDFEIFVESP
jgi:hypothetical protein